MYNVFKIHFENVNSCNCVGDLYFTLNEMEINIPLKQYKKISNLDIWTIIYIYYFWKNI